MTPNTSAHPSVDGRELLARAGFTHLAADYVPSGCDAEEGWRVHDFLAGSYVAHCLCDGLEEGEAKLIAAAVNAYPDYLDRLTATAALQERITELEALVQRLEDLAETARRAVSDSQGLADHKLLILANYGDLALQLAPAFRATLTKGATA